MTIVMPPTAVSTLINEIEKGREGILFVRDRLGQVDSANAKASMAQDEVKVKEMIQGDVGFDAVNLRIKQFLVKWMAVEVQNLHEQLNYDQCPIAMQIPAVLSRSRA